MSGILWKSANGGNAKQYSTNMIRQNTPLPIQAVKVGKNIQFSKTKFRGNSFFFANDGKKHLWNNKAGIKNILIIVLQFFIHLLKKHLIFLTFKKS